MKKWTRGRTNSKKVQSLLKLKLPTATEDLKSFLVAFRYIAKLMLKLSKKKRPIQTFFKKKTKKRDLKTNKKF